MESNTFVEKKGEKIPKILWVDFNSDKIGNICRSRHLEFMKKTKIYLNLTPIEEHTLVDRTDNRFINRTQFPLNSAEGIIIHKSQGSTLQEVCIDLTGRKPSTSLIYVGLSRVTSLEGLYIVDKLPVPDERGINETANIVDHMKKTKQVKLCYDIEIRGDILRIVYLNIYHLKNKIEHIISDNWYKQFDVLVFSETYTKEKDDSKTHLALPQFSVAFRSDEKSGLICYFKESIFEKYSNTKFTLKLDMSARDQTKQHHMFLLHFKVQDVNIITGYKSPSTPFSVFESTFIEFYGNCCEDDKIVFLGDFNIDTILDNSKLHTFLGAMKFSKTLMNETSTTNFGSQIDTIFVKNIKNQYSGIYETYFSDHKPIFIGISSGEAAVVKEENSSEQKSIAPNLSKENISKPSINSIISKSVPEREENLVNILRANNKHIPSKNVQNKEISKKNVDKRNEIIDLDDYDDSHIIPRSDEQTQIDSLNAIRNEIRNPYTHLKSDTINYIGEFISRHITQYKFQHTINTSIFHDRIEEIANKSDIQILFQAGVSPQDIGHWICIKYDHNINKVYVYDSLNATKLPDENILAIEKLYPQINIFKDITFKKVKYNQMNGSACGVYACIFAISLAFDKDPAQLEYNINRQLGSDESEFLRLKLLQILLEDDLSEFPF